MSMISLLTCFPSSLASEVDDDCSEELGDCRMSGWTMMLGE